MAVEEELVPPPGWGQGCGFRFGLGSEFEVEPPPALRSSLAVLQDNRRRGVGGLALAQHALRINPVVGPRVLRLPTWLGL
eukprot:scaffold135547_cov127-Phaeocystis_antarctica.AAC.1